MFLQLETRMVTTNSYAHAPKIAALYSDRTWNLLISELSREELSKVFQRLITCLPA